MGQKNIPHILIVDDLEPNHLLMKKYLEPFGCQLDHGYDGREGLGKLQFNHYDLCFTDIHMPDIDGIILANYARLELGLTLPIIMLSGTADEEEREIALGVGMEDFIFKPLQANQVKTIVSRYLNSTAQTL